uniref:ARAD1B19338p n=1 Tax=Blastobotrys adeninivorans TaxID=409370 RepID=A0A060TC18_BLAAD
MRHGTSWTSSRRRLYHIDHTKMPEPEKVIKHPPVRLAWQVNQRAFDIQVKATSPFMGVVNRTKKRLERISKDKIRARPCVKVMGLGKAMNKALSVGSYFAEKRHRIEIFTGTEVVFDEVVKDGTSTRRKREVSKVEIKIYP